jgi:hypothetical protein
LRQHVRHLVAAQVEVDRDRHRAGAQDGELGRHEFKIVRHHERDAVAGPDAAGDQPRGELPGPVVHGGIGDGAGRRNDQRRVRMFRGGPCEAHRDRMRFPSREAAIQLLAAQGGAGGVLRHVGRVI